MHHSRSLMILTFCLLVFSMQANAADIPVPPGVQIKRDIAYGDDPLQKLDVYLPAKIPPHAAVILMVHGGAWMAGDKWSNGVVQNKVAHWVPKGYVFISANYRLVPKATPLEQTDDIAKALAYAQAHANEWGADP